MDKWQSTHLMIIIRQSSVRFSHSSSRQHGCGPLQDRQGKDRIDDLCLFTSWCWPQLFSSLLLMWDSPTKKLTFSTKFSSISWHLSSLMSTPSIGKTAKLSSISNPHWPYMEMSRYSSPRSWHSMFFTWATSQSSFQLFLTLNCSTFGWTRSLLTKKFHPS